MFSLAPQPASKQRGSHHDTTPSKVFLLSCLPFQFDREQQACSACPRFAGKHQGPTCLARNQQAHKFAQVCVQGQLRTCVVGTSRRLAMAGIPVHRQQLCPLQVECLANRMLPYLPTALEVLMHVSADCQDMCDVVALLNQLMLRYKTLLQDLLQEVKPSLPSCVRLLSLHCITLYVSDSCLSACLPACLSIGPGFCMSDHMSVRPSFCLSGRLSV